MPVEIYARTRFVAFHRWKDAPSEHAFLSQPHRHEFHVEIAVRVRHGNRDVEFISLREAVDFYIKSQLWPRTSPEHCLLFSCEDLADAIGTGMREHGYDVHYVDVSEDGENGGRVFYA